jgi:acetylornithine deacetylase
MNPAEMLGRLVAFDTTSSKSNLELIEFVAGILAEYAGEPQFTYNDDRTKANLWATVGPADRPGVVLSGHTDVVPVTGQPWTTDPFVMTERDGRLYGRGTADMKGFLACVLCALPEFVARRPKSPVHVAFSYDEEVGCLGAPRLLAALPDDLPAPRYAVIGEPTDLRLANTHKGIRVLQTQVTGLDGHSSAPDLGCSAISAAVKMIDFLDGVAGELRRKADASLPFEPPWTTLNVGIIEGGTACNIIPRECRFDWEYRPLPDDDPRAVRERLQAFVDEELVPAGGGRLSVEVSELVGVPALAPAPSAEPALASLGAILGDTSDPVGMSFTTEAGLFQAAGIPAVVCGPGSIAQAHRPDEFITVAALEAGMRFVDGICAGVAELE